MSDLNKSTTIKQIEFDGAINLDNQLISSQIEYVKINNELLNYFNCSICLCPAIDPILCPSEHIFCYACICRNFEYQSKCPQCNVETPLDNYDMAVRPIRETLDSLEVYCLYKKNGCNQTMMRNQLFNHIKVCEYTHKMCDCLILDANGQTNKCGLIYHIDDQLKHIHCRYAVDGCRIICSKDEIIEHEKQCNYYLMTPLLNKFKNRINQYENKLGELFTISAEYESDIAAAFNLIHELTLQVENQKLQQNPNSSIDDLETYFNREIKHVFLTINELKEQVKNFQSQQNPNPLIEELQETVRCDLSTAFSMIHALKEQAENPKSSIKNVDQSIKNELMTYVINEVHNQLQEKVQKLVKEPGSSFLSSIFLYDDVNEQRKQIKDLKLQVEKLTKLCAQKENPYPFPGSK
jgi:hypothetical protein